jgi:hypothetical protein
MTAFSHPLLSAETGYERGQPTWRRSYRSIIRRGPKLCPSVPARPKLVRGQIIAPVLKGYGNAGRRFARKDNTGVARSFAIIRFIKSAITLD